MIISMSLNPSSIEKAIEKVKEYSNNVESKTRMLCERLAELGAWYAEWNFSGVDWTYSGDVEYDIDVKGDGDNRYVVYVSGQGVLFIEFGAGISLGYGHPLADQMGMGPGTYPPTNPEKPHWNDPHGWWFKDSGGEKVHTYGNAPGMPVYNAAQDLRREIKSIAREVFQS